MSSIQPTPAPSEPTRSASAPTSAVRDAIVTAGERFGAAFDAGDADAVAAFYASNAQVLPPNSDVVAGTDAIRELWRSVMMSGIAGIRLETTDVETQGDLAVETGRYTLLGADGGTVDHGKYLVAWRRDGGNWKIYRDMWSTSRPAAVA